MLIVFCMSLMCFDFLAYFYFYRNEQFFEKQSSFKNEKLLTVLDDLNMVYPSTAIATIEHYMKCFVERKIIPLPRKQTFGKFFSYFY